MTEPRDVVVIAGPDAMTYLQSQIAQELTDLETGGSRWTLVLQPDGHVDVLARIWRRADDTYALDTDAGYGDVLETRLRRFMLRTKADVTRETAIATIDVDAGEPASADVVGWWGRGSVTLTPGDAPVASAPEPDSLRHARIAAGWPAMGAEIVPGERIPAEIGVVHAAASFTKGCYPGQELVERMDSRGAQAPRRLCQLAVDAGAQAGDPIVVDGNEAGTLTSVAGQLALGYVKRNVDAGVAVADL